MNIKRVMRRANRKLDKATRISNRVKRLMGKYSKLLAEANDLKKQAEREIAMMPKARPGLALLVCYRGTVDGPSRLAKIIYQQARGELFWPTGSFKATNGLWISSLLYPEVSPPCHLFVRGEDEECDNNTLDMSDDVYFANVGIAVREYNLAVEADRDWLERMVPTRKGTSILC